MYICLCKGITDKAIRSAVIDGANTFASVRKTLGVASQCGRCAVDTKDLINTTLDEIATFQQAKFYAAM